MIWVTCKGCGFFMQFEAAELCLSSFNYRCPMCQYRLNEDLKMRTPVKYLPLMEFPK